VIAHEVTHILQGIARHSDQGLMKPCWNRADYNEMAWKSLPLTDEDVRLIHLGLQGREAQLSGAMIATTNLASAPSQQ
jgi:hypothetical protein